LEFVILGLAAAGVAFVLPIFLLFRTHKMKERITALERRVQGLIGDAVAPEAKEAKPEVHQPWTPPEEKIKPPVAAKVQDEPKQTAPVQQPAKPRKAFVFKPSSGEKIVA
jgi:hypothetical protein